MQMVAICQSVVQEPLNVDWGNAMTGRFNIAYAMAHPEIVRLEVNLLTARHPSLKKGTIDTNSYMLWVFTTLAWGHAPPIEEPTSL